MIDGLGVSVPETHVVGIEALHVILGEGVISFEVAFFDGKLVVAHGKIVFPPASFIKGRQLDIV